MSVHDLFKSKPNNLPIERRYNTKQLEGYVADLQYVVDEMEKGAARPTMPALIAHMQAEHGMEVVGDTLRRHIIKLAKGETLWQSKTS